MRAKRLYFYILIALIILASFAVLIAIYNPYKPVKIKAKDVTTAIEKYEVQKLLETKFAISLNKNPVLGAQSPIEVKKEGPKRTAEFTFNAIAPSWEVESPNGSEINFEIRTSNDGEVWGEWKAIEEDEDGDAKDSIRTNKKFGRLVVLDGKYLQERVTFKTDRIDKVPTLKNLKLTYLDSKEKRNLIEKLLKRIKLKAKEVFASSHIPSNPGDDPQICNRACWGADESIYVPGEEYSPIKKMIVHHTVTSNNDPDPASTVRAIYYFHNVERGWGDIGYNFLIDQNNGTIYEGRYGGDSVVGAHAKGYNYGSVGVAVLGDFRYVGPNKKVQNALQKIAVWKLYFHNIDPDDNSLFGNPYINVPAITFHGQLGLTACAGTNLNNFIPALRSIARYMPQQILLRNGSGIQKIEGNNDQTVDDLLSIYASQGAVAPNYIRRISAFPSDGTTPPNDANYNSQWDLPKLDALDVWKETSGGLSSIKVAVIDTGAAYENYDPSGSENYAKGPDFASTNFVPGYDYVNNDSHPNDDHGHGTIVASMIAETTNNAIGSASLAYNLSIMPIKVCNRYGWCTDQDIASGIDFARTNGAKVINMSLGGDFYSQVMQDAIDAAWNVGTVIVAAAGNDGDPVVSYPGRGAHVISVGALDSSDNRAGYSNYGSGLDLAAPGGYGLGGSGDLLYQYLNCTADLNCTAFDYAWVAGTSMAAPLVSATAGLLISKAVSNPGTIESVLLSTATDIGTPGFDSNFAYGRVNPKGALNFYWNTGSSTNVYRLYSTVTADHFYTADIGERNFVPIVGYLSEGTGFLAYRTAATGTRVIYRMFSMKTGDHFYTANSGEKDAAASRAYYISEGFAFWAYLSQSDAGAIPTQPVYRLYNTRSGDHLYTTNVGEKNNALSNGHIDEGVAFWVPTN